ncbi:MAG TPA: IS1380 family transposase, partial [Allocoleopsis sp.]
KTECSAETYSFGQLERRQIVADFSGGELTHDGGLILTAEIDRRNRISERVAKCFEDQREQGRVQHELQDLVAQRLYGLVQGYEDLNDHEQLRHERMFGIAVGKLESEHRRCAPLAGKSTLNRLEQAMHGSGDLSEERYVKFSLNPLKMESLFVEVFIEQHGKEPQQIILDLDVSDDPVHGAQEQAFFNGYYDHECYAPLFIFCGRHLLAAKLRPSNVDPADGALEEVKRIIREIRQQWKAVVIVVRGDSAYGREEIMSWCESQINVEYVLAYSSNERLERFTWGLEQRAKAVYEQQRQDIASTLQAVVAPAADLQVELDALVPPQVWYQSLSYQTLDSWSRERRVVCKLSYDGKGSRRHFVVTSFSSKHLSPGKLHRDYYCPRGEMENRIKEHQLDLFSDRTSTHNFESNQLRLWFSSFAYVLMQALRQQALTGTELADAQLGTIRLKLLKVSAQIRLSVRRVVIALSSVWVSQSLFHRVYQRLQKLPQSG